jgi:hypothetical protein
MLVTVSTAKLHELIALGWELVAEYCCLRAASVRVHERCGVKPRPPRLPAASCCTHYTHILPAQVATYVGGPAWPSVNQRDLQTATPELTCFAHSRHLSCNSRPAASPRKRTFTAVHRCTSFIICQQSCQTYEIDFLSRGGNTGAAQLRRLNMSGTNARRCRHSHTRGGYQKLP